MLRSALLVCLGLLTCAGLPGKAADVRYFAVWSYTENAPREEIPASRIAEGGTAYWVLEFDAEGRVLGATYHGADGAMWVYVRYVEEGGRVYADVYGSSGELVTRKSTTLSDRRPRWPVRD